MQVNPETVAINFKGTGQKAYINRADFDPAVHKLWTETDERADKAPLPAPAKPAASNDSAAPQVPWAQPAAAPARAAKTRKA